MKHLKLQGDLHITDPLVAHIELRKLDGTPVLTLEETELRPGEGFSWTYPGAGITIRFG